MDSQNNTRPILQYLRDSLADADLFECAFDGPGCWTLTLSEVINGELEDVSRFRIPEKEFLNVAITPLHIRSKYCHQTGTPDKYAPVLISAVICHRGTIRISGSSPVWIPRRFLAPNTDDVFTVGEMDKADEFLTQNEAPKTLPDAFHFAEKMLDFVCEMPHKQAFEQASFLIEDTIVATKIENAKQVNRRLIEVYDALIKSNSAPGLLGHFTDVENNHSVVWRTLSARHNRRHLGQFKSTFALSHSQRSALDVHLSRPLTNIVAVSGPPGTGKTTLIQSAIATRIVDAALKDTAPPIIVGTSTNNQAIINILTSLAAGDGEGFERWLLKEPDQHVKDFGVYVPAQSKTKEMTREDIPRFETNNPDACSAGFIFSRKHAEIARAHFLNKCRSFFGVGVATLDDAQALIRAQLLRVHNGFLKLIDLHERYDELVALNLDHRKDDLVSQISHATQVDEHIKALFKAWMHTRSLWFEISQYFRVFSPVKQWRSARLFSFCLEHRIPLCEGGDLELLSHICSYLKQQAEENDALKKILAAKLKECEDLLLLRNQLCEEYLIWWKDFGQNDEALGESLEKMRIAVSEDNALNAWLDKNLRFQMFMWATRYFEAKFLIRTLERKGLLTRNEEINLLSYVYPCIVTTFHMATNLFSDGSGYLFEKIDLLIVDEAAQALTELAGPILAFSKEALILGDEKQLEPVRSIHRHIDKSNLLQRRVIKSASDYYSPEIQAFASSSGNLLAAASRYSPKDDKGRLPILLEHRRCVPDIIAYCNELAYDGALRSMRSPVMGAPWRPLSYGHFEGEMLLNGSSRYNPLEAAAIMEWLKTNESNIKQRFSCRDLKEAVAVLTPFTAQKFELMIAAKRAGLDLDKIGTVHVMQGAERPLVIFSPVYDAEYTGPLLFDQSINMLNVAVSRARDHFLVIGNMSIFDPLRMTPSGQLAAKLFSTPEAELLDVEPRVRVSNLAPPKSIRTLDRHREALRWSFRTAKSKMFIVSPFLSLRAMEDDLVFDAIDSANDRGVLVSIYFDPYLTSQTLSSAHFGLIRQRIGNKAALIPIERIHAKVIAVDDSCLIKGSFNWLSASRNPDFARYEVSHYYSDRDARTEILLIKEELRMRAGA